jgi:hypothetical protein
MRKDEFWKNFKLGKELDIAGRFIYNGLQTFHGMKHFAYEEEIFEFLYNISVGLERLIKITIILIEHDEDLDQQSFEESLITHNHGELLNRVKKTHKINVCTPHNEFLAILSKFYKTSRYGRYSLAATSIEDWEKTELIKFLNKNLKITIDTKTPFGITPNNQRIKKFIGKIVGKFCEILYEIIIKESHRLNIFTYEVRYPSKAFKIFLSKEYDFDNEDILRRELLIYFLNSSDDGAQSRFMRSITPLNFDPSLEPAYVRCFDSNVEAMEVMEELETLYEDEIKDVKDRIGTLKSIEFYFEYNEQNENDDDNQF